MVYKELNLVLKKLLDLSQEGHKSNYSKIDSSFLEVLEKHKIDDDYGLVIPLYWLTDVLADSLSHGFEEIYPNYSVAQALDDLRTIITIIDDNKIEELESDHDLIKRLKTPYIKLPRSNWFKL